MAHYNITLATLFIVPFLLIGCGSSSSSDSQNESAGGDQSSAIIDDEQAASTNLTDEPKGRKERI